MLSKDQAPTRCLVTLLKVATVGDIKTALVKIYDNTFEESDLVIAEAFDNHIARLLVNFLHQLFVKLCF